MHMIFIGGCKMTDFKKTLCNAGLMEGRIAKVYAHGIDICEKLKLHGLKTVCVRGWSKHIGTAASLTLACMSYSETIEAIKKGGSSDDN
jgi:hypothetical protein